MILRRDTCFRIATAGRIKGSDARRGDQVIWMAIATQFVGGEISNIVVMEALKDE